MSEITVLSKPSCVQCNATTRALDKSGTVYTKMDMSQDLSALEFARGLGYQQAPVVLIKDESGNVTDHWSGFNPEKIAEYV